MDKQVDYTQDMMRLTFDNGVGTVEIPEDQYEICCAAMAEYRNAGLIGEEVI